MKTAMQQFIERAGEKIDFLNCEIVEKIKNILIEEKLSLISAYEVGISTASEMKDVEGNDYYKQLYTDSNENTNAKSDLQPGRSTRQNNKYKRKKAA